MLTSFIVLVFVLVAGVVVGRGPRPSTLQPAMAVAATDAARRRLGPDVFAALRFDEDDDTSIVMDSLRALGLVRRRIERPVVGKKAYVRLWERVRAVIVLGAIIVSIGVMLAATIGIIVLAAGFLLEQAIA